MRRLSGLALALLLVIGGHRLDESRCAAQAPIPAGPDAYTQAQFNKELLAYHMRMVKEYDAHTADKKALRKEARELIGTSRRWLLRIDPPRDAQAAHEVRKGFHDRAMALMKQGSADPLVICVAASGSWDAEDATMPIGLVRQARAALAKSTYGPRERADVLGRCFGVEIVVSERPNAARIKPDNAELIPALVEWLAAEGQARDDQRFIWQTLAPLIDSRPFAESKPLAELVEKREGIDPWMREMVLAAHHSRNAWALDRMPNGPNQQSFGEQIKLAGDHFHKAWKANPRIPETAGQLITIARIGFSDQKPRYWFDQAVALQFDHKYAYTALRTALRPGFGGSQAALYQFGKECAATKRWDTSVPFELLESLQAIESVRGYEDPIWKQPGIYENVKKLCDDAIAAPDYMGEPNHPRAQMWMRATNLAIAARAERNADMEPLWAQVADEAMLNRALQMYHVTTPIETLRAQSKTAAAGK